MLAKTIGTQHGLPFCSWRSWCVRGYAACYNRSEWDSRLAGFSPSCPVATPATPTKHSLDSHHFLNFTNKHSRESYFRLWETQLENSVLWFWGVPFHKPACSRRSLCIWLNELSTWSNSKSCEKMLFPYGRESKHSQCSQLYPIPDIPQVTHSGLWNQPALKPTPEAGWQKLPRSLSLLSRSEVRTLGSNFNFSWPTECFLVPRILESWTC